MTKLAATSDDEIPKCLEPSSSCLQTNGKPVGRLMRWLPWNSGTADDGTIPDEREVPPPNPEHAWKALALVNEWIRHSDAKAGVTLAFAGVLGTMTFNLVKVVECRTTLIDVLVVVTCVLIGLTGGLCGWTLTPRVNDKDADRDAINRLFFASISQNFKGKRSEYASVLHTLTADPVELTRDLADQIHANARIATVKAKYAKWAMRSALAAAATVAVLALLIGSVGK